MKRVLTNTFCADPSSVPRLSQLFVPVPSSPVGLGLRAAPQGPCPVSLGTWVWTGVTGFASSECLEEHVLYQAVSPGCLVPTEEERATPDAVAAGARPADVILTASYRHRGLCSWTSRRTALALSAWMSRFYVERSRDPFRSSPYSLPEGTPVTLTRNRVQAGTKEVSGAVPICGWCDCVCRKSQGIKNKTKMTPGMTKQ